MPVCDRQGGISAAELELDAVLQELEAEDDAEKTTVGISTTPVCRRVTHGAWQLTLPTAGRDREMEGLAAESAELLERRIILCANERK
jgi:hypothetical protein